MRGGQFQTSPRRSFYGLIRRSSVISPQMTIAVLRLGSDCGQPFPLSNLRLFRIVSGLAVIRPLGC